MVAGADQIKCRSRWRTTRQQITLFQMPAPSSILDSIYAQMRSKKQTLDLCGAAVSIGKQRPMVSTHPPSSIQSKLKQDGIAHPQRRQATASQSLTLHRILIMPTIRQDMRRHKAIRLIHPSAALRRRRLSRDRHWGRSCHAMLRYWRLSHRVKGLRQLPWCHRNGHCCCVTLRMFKRLLI